MKKEHFIRRITDTIRDHYVVTAAGLAQYDEEFLNRLKDKMYSDEYRKNEKERISRERTAYVENRAADLRALEAAILAEERADITKRLTAVMPTQAQLNTLAMLKSLKNLTQNEFNAYADTLKGCYANEKALAEIAEDRRLQFEFVPMDRQLKRVDDFAKEIEHTCVYAGNNESGRWGNETYSNGYGIPYYSQYLFKFGDEVIAEYEAGRFEEKVPEKAITPMEALDQLKNDHPNYTAQVSAFIDQNKQSLGNELFASRLQDFINNIKELDKPTGDVPPENWEGK